VLNGFIAGLESQSQALIAVQVIVGEERDTGRSRWCGGRSHGEGRGMAACICCLAHVCGIWTRGLGALVVAWIDEFYGHELMEERKDAGLGVNK
jgi:hypothetical protein